MQVCLCVSECACGGQKIACENKFSSSPPHVVPGDQTQVARLEGITTILLIHLSGPFKSYPSPSNALCGFHMTEEVLCRCFVSGTWWSA